MKPMTNQKVIKALTKIADANNGILRPMDVVAAAQKPSSVLHPYFEWDEGKAAHQYRLSQARDLIQVTVEYLPQSNKQPYRVFVSLTPDRKMLGGGYRHLSAVLEDESMRGTFLLDALNEMELFQKKYHSLEELASVFTEMKKVSEMVETQRHRKSSPTQHIVARVSS